MDNNTKQEYKIIELLSGEDKDVVNKAFQLRKNWGMANPGLVLAFMPGNVVEYKVKVGDKVKKGDVLLLFKAMKMNNRILSPIDGTVKSLNAEIDANVAKNTLLMEVE